MTQAPDSEHRDQVAGSGVGAPQRVLCVAAVHGDPGDTHVLTGDQLPATARRAPPAVAGEPADAHARPVIESRLLENRDDRQHAVRSLQMALQLAEQKPMRDIARPVWPPPQVLRRADWLDAFIRRVSDSGYHPSGTVPMGKDGDPAAATDGRGRVRGVAPPVCEQT